MKREILDILCCPQCKHNLKLVEEEVSNCEVIEGTLVCTRCGIHFEISKGVPRMILNLNDRREMAEGWGFEWKLREEGKFEINTLYGETEEKEVDHFFDFFGITPEDLSGKVILDAGCGSGRLTKALGKYGAQIYGIDIATSIELVYEYCKPQKNVHIIQADILTQPFKNASFDYVWSKLAICYVRDPERAFKMLSNVVKSSGRLFVSVPSKTDMSFVNRLKELFKISHRIPRELLIYLCWCLAPLLYLAKIVIKRQKTSLRSNTFYLFNALQSEFFTLHSLDEVQSWFINENYWDIVYIPDQSPGHRHAVPIRGTKN
jgi:SAM-dependent methyltransferase